MRTQFSHVVWDMGTVKGNTGIRARDQVKYTWYDLREVYIWSCVLFSGVPCAAITTVATVFHEVSRSDRFYWSNYAFIF